MDSFLLKLWAADLEILQTKISESWDVEGRQFYWDNFLFQVEKSPNLSHC